jgi:hypothetical protein
VIADSSATVSLLAFEQGQQADAGGVGEHLEACRPAFEIHAISYQPIAI